MCNVSSGAWILELAHLLSSTSILVGTDISMDLLPKSHPPNVFFQQCSTLNMPNGWSGKFDFVHQRLLIVGFTPVEWPSALKEMYRVLCPGGWAQLVELAGWSCEGCETMTEHGWKLMATLFDKHGFDGHLAEKLSDLLASAGFISIAAEGRNTSLYGTSDRAKRARESTRGAFRVANAASLKLAGTGFEDFDGLMSAMEKEWKEVEGIKKCFRVVYGQKAFN